MLLHLTENARNRLSHLLTSATRLLPALGSCSVIVTDDVYDDVTPVAAADLLPDVAGDGSVDVVRTPFVRKPRKYR